MTWRDRARCRGMDPDLLDINAEGNTGTLGLRICTGLHRALVRNGSAWTAFNNVLWSSLEDEDA
jgi:hypothetical protein